MMMVDHLVEGILVIIMISIRAQLTTFLTAKKIVKSIVNVNMMDMIGAISTRATWKAAATLDLW
jgi:hypothetical protein